ncbi:MAG: glycosyltransferase family 4 protein [Gemmatimonadetes bacterium]|nr:glycosyltransferase family 4 protein [Gemmatimonadota bacterium]
MSPFAVGPAVAALVSLAGAWWLSRPGAPLQALDHPGHRSLHDRPTPRTGGLAVLAAIGAGLLGSGWARPLSGAGVGVLAGLVAVAAVSLADDRAGVRAGYRFLVHLLAAGLAVGSAPDSGGRRARAARGYGDSGGVLGLVWMINLYNFMDGMDGFAGGMSLAGFGGLALLALPWGPTWYPLACAVVAAAALGFLGWNFPPARIFLGDVGSAPLGYLAGVGILTGAGLGAFPLPCGLLVFLPFIADASFTLARRIVAGERFWEPHRTHLYQRLVLAGWSHRRVVLWEYLLMALTGGTGLLVAPRGAQVAWVALGAWTTVLLLLAWGLGRWLGARRP